MTNEKWKMNPNPLRLMIVAGEASGDMHAAALVCVPCAQKRSKFNSTFDRLVASEMRAAGVDPVVRSDDAVDSARCGKSPRSASAPAGPWRIETHLGCHPKA